MPTRPGEKSFGWTDARCDELTRLHTEGYTASEIARIMACGLTRNAVIGKISRLKLPPKATRVAAPVRAIGAPRPPAAPRVPRPPAGAVDIARAGEVSRGNGVSSSTERVIRDAIAVARFEPETPSAAAPMPAPPGAAPRADVPRRTILTLEPGMCKYAVTTPPPGQMMDATLFCAAPIPADRRDAGDVYCAHCKTLVYAPSAKSAKASVRDLVRQVTHAERRRAAA